MLSKTAQRIFEMKYAKDGKETWQQAAARVAYYVSSPEEDQPTWLRYFYALINELYFIPGGRILANSGTDITNLMNCFVLPIEDSRESIYGTLKQAADVFAHGGGIGYNFSNLRERGADISIGGKSSGALSFMGLFDNTGEVIKQASRRGAQMGILNINHPDIVEFINNKARLDQKNTRILYEFTDHPMNTGDVDEVLEKILLDNQLTHFNISTAISDDFMNAVSNNEEWYLISPKTGEVVSKVDASKLFKLIAERAWATGDPGVFFIDRVNDDNLVPYIGKIDATNPCGEVPLLPYESCCLGSLNLHNFYDKDRNRIDLEFLEFSTRAATRFLDNVQTLSESTVPEINVVSKGLRKLGLGVMGWADLLAELELPYDSEEATELAKYLSWFISHFAWLESITIAEEKGSFEFFDRDSANLSIVERTLNSEYTEHRVELDGINLRNSSVTSIAPTGSIALIAGVNSSIEPFYALSYTRNITEGVGNLAKETIHEVNPILLSKLEELEYSKADILKVKQYISKNKTIKGCSLVPKKLQEVFKTAHEISWEDHVAMQAAWQSYVSNAVSKTINLPEDATIEDVAGVYYAMWNSGLKGGTVYRDKSKTFQILES